MSTISSMLNEREPVSPAGNVLARLSIYQQLDDERHSLIQVSTPDSVMIIVITTTATTAITITTVIITLNF